MNMNISNILMSNKKARALYRAIHQAQALPLIIMNLMDMVYFVGRYREDPSKENREQMFGVLGIIESQAPVIAAVLAEFDNASAAVASFDTKSSPKQKPVKKTEDKKDDGKVFSLFDKKTSSEE